MIIQNYYLRLKFDTRNFYLNNSIQVPYIQSFIIHFKQINIQLVIINEGKLFKLHLFRLSQ